MTIKKITVYLSLAIGTVLIGYGVAAPAHSPTLAQPNIDHLDSEQAQFSKTQQNLVLQQKLDELPIQSKSYLVYEEGTGRTLAAKSIDNPISIASLTKLMTTLVVIEGANLSDIYTVEKSGLVYINPILKLREGDKVRVEDLVRSILIGSANDAALSLGVYYKLATGQDIIEAMNEKAQKLEMSATRFNNPIGFDSDTNYSSAEDIQKLLKYINQYPIFSEVSRESSYSFQSVLGNRYAVDATNKLIARFPDLEAVKTGFTNDANGAMVVKVRAQPKTVIIVLNSADREGDVILIREQLLQLYSEFQE